MPGGSTVMDIPSLPSMTLGGAAKAGTPAEQSTTPPPPTGEPKPAAAQKPDEKKTPQHASARDAAKAILEKMWKRNRSG